MKIFGDREEGGEPGGWGICAFNLVGEKNEPPRPKQSLPRETIILQQVCAVTSSKFGVKKYCQFLVFVILFF